MEHREAELREVAPYDAPGDNPARFLRELQQLRDGAGLGQTELAIRAHYPRDAIRAAEAGPALPDLPVLSAYVRGCGGAVTEWEERWRALTSSPTLPLLPSRTAGNSDAATAGARVGSASLAADSHDPAFVMAALSRVAHGIATEPQSASVFTPASSSPSTASPVPPVPMPATGADGVAAEPASVFGTSSGGAEAPRAAAADADWVSSATDAGWGAVLDAGRGAAEPPAPPAQPPAPPILTPESALGRPISTGPTLPSKPVLVAVAILIGLIVVLLAIFA